MVKAISTARALALKVNQKAQQCNKQQYNKKTTMPKLKVGNWALASALPKDETGKTRKLPKLWHGPIQLSNYDPDMTFSEVN